MVATLGQHYNNTGEKPTVMLCIYINRHAGTPDKTKLIIIYNSNSAIDPYTIRALSLEHKQCYNNIVICKDKYIYILQLYQSAGTFYSTFTPNNLDFPRIYPFLCHRPLTCIHPQILGFDRISGMHLYFQHTHFIPIVGVGKRGAY